MAQREGWPFARICPALWINSQSNFRKLPGPSALKNTFCYKRLSLKTPLGNRSWKQLALQANNCWPKEEEAWMAVRHNTSPCISLGPFLLTYNEGTHSAKLRQITWVSSSTYRLFNELVSKGVTSAKVINVDKLCLDLHGIYSSTTSAEWSWLCGPDFCIQAKRTTNSSFLP